MHLSDTITISDIINSVLAIITLCGVFITYRTLIEMKEQRLLSIKPQLALTLTKSFCEDRSFEYLGSPRLVLHNLGNGVAKDICIKYHISINEIAEISSVVHNDSYSKIYLNKFNYRLNDIIDKEEIKYIKTIDSILKDQKIKISMEVLGGVLVAGLTSRYVKNIEWKKKIVFPIEIRYKDILDNNYRTIYEVGIKLFKVTDINTGKDEFVKDSNSLYKFNIDIDIVADIKDKSRLNKKC